MNVKEMWAEYKKSNTNVEDKYEVWKFGVNTDLLSNLVMNGEKTATTSAYLLYEIESKPLPIIGTYHVILNSKNEAMCIIQITRVYITKFKEISKEHAYKEGEGDKSLYYWKKSHKDFFVMCMSEVNEKFSEDMKVVCEEFKVVFK